MIPSDMHSQNYSKKIKPIIQNTVARLFISLAFFIHLDGYGQETDSLDRDSLAPTVSAQIQDTAEAPRYKSLFWEIKRDDLKTPSYLYGTIHIIPKDSFFLTPAVEEKLASTQQLVLEIPLDLNITTMLSSAMGMMMPSGKSLKSLYSDDDYQRISSFMKDSLSTPLPFYQMFKPIFISQHISSNYCNTSAQESYEMYFSQLFKKAKKPISGLETIEAQMKYLDEMTLEEQAQGLLQTIENPGEACSQYAEMVSVYRQQDLNKLMEMMGESEEVGDHLDKLLDERNQNWISQIEALVAKESVFIAVGAGHLPGPKGVIELLRKQGYQVNPL
jgi:uncharacterized protein YbaP (TraB family)